MPATCGAAPIGVTNLSRLDLSDEENVKDAAHELRHCVSDYDFSRWARRWGGVFVDRALSGPDRDAIEDTETYREVNDALNILGEEVREQLATLDAVAERESTPDVISNELGEISAALDAAVRKAL